MRASIAMDDGYLGRSVNRRTYEADRILRASIDRVIREASAKGMLGSGNTIWSFRTEALRIFEEQFRETAQFVFNLTETNEGDSASALVFYTKRVAGMFIQHLRDASTRLGVPEGLIAGEVTKIGVALEERRTQVLDDFVHGMMGSARMKKDPIVTIALNQTSSPNAVQQVGFGRFSQSAYSQQHNALVEAVDAALRSADFLALPQQQRDAFKDMADVLKEEASKPQPDDAKLKRWGERVSEFGQEIGAHAATAAIREILKSIFGG